MRFRLKRQQQQTWHKFLWTNCWCLIASSSFFWWIMAHNLSESFSTPYASHSAQNGGQQSPTIHRLVYTPSWWARPLSVNFFITLTSTKTTGTSLYNRWRNLITSKRAQKKQDAIKSNIGERTADSDRVGTSVNPPVLSKTVVNTNRRKQSVARQNFHNAGENDNSSNWGTAVT